MNPGDVLQGLVASCCRQRWMIGVINWPSTVDSIVDLVDLQRSSLLH